VLERKLDRKIKFDFYACHTCDIPNCVNEDHLHEGDAVDNANDAKRLKPDCYSKRAKEWIATPKGQQHIRKLHETYANSPHNKERMRCLGSTVGIRNLVLARVHRILEKWSLHRIGNVEIPEKTWEQMTLISQEELKALFDRYGVTPPKL